MAEIKKENRSKSIREKEMELWYYNTIGKDVMKWL